MTKQEQGIYSFLGLCMKAGKVTSGETGTLQNIQSGKAKLVIVSRDASDNTRKEMLNKCKSYSVKIEFFGQKDLLGLSIGKSERSSLAITDQGMAKALIQKLLTIEQNGGETNVKD